MKVARSIEPISIPGSNVKVALGAGNLAHVGRIAQESGATRVLLVSDPGIMAAGYDERALKSLRDAGIHVELFTNVGENPTTDHVEAGVRFASAREIDFIIGLGGGSSMDAAKGINFILTNCGRMQDYWGVNLARKPLLPMIAVPTTAGTGSDAQSFALITDPQTHQKMACGDKRALPRVSILDPDLTATQPPRVAAATGIDAITHAVETAATTKRNPTSLEFSKAAWGLLESSYETAMRDPSNAVAREKMLLGSHLAGCAIENSMLGAAHALANALTALCGLVHGVAVGMMLPHVVRFNSVNGNNPYSELGNDAQRLAARIEQFLIAGQIPRRLGDARISPDSIAELAPIAAKQWTATFNPRPVSESDLRQILLDAV
jgi:alcohol dehydrogenase